MSNGACEHSHMPWFTATREGVVLTVHAAPRAARSELAGEHGDALRIRLQAPPADGKANAALVAFLAAALDIPARQVELLSGTAGRRKRVLLRGVSAAAVQQWAGRTLAAS